MMSRAFPPMAYFLFTLIFLAVSIDAHAWLMVTHYSMLPDGNYANGPDLLPTDLFSMTTGEMTPDFLWSHGLVGTGAQASGEVWETPGPPSGQWAWLGVWLADWSQYDRTHWSQCPRAALTAACREPGHVMWNLLSQKMDRNLPGRENWNWTGMQNTARGWAAHNAADNVVHFSFFEAGDGNAWIGNHGLKEEWAELYLIAYANEGVFPNSWSSPALYATYSMSEARIINLAQKVFRKNGFALDNANHAGDPRPGPVMRSADIVTCIAQHASANQAIANNYSATRFDELKAHRLEYSDPSMAHYHDWNTTTLISKYTQAQVDAMDAITAMP